MSLDDRACTYIIWTVKLDLGVLALVVMYGLVTVIHTKRIALEVQFQKRAEFYWEFVGEIFLYLSQYKPEHDWQAVAIFAKRSIAPEIPKQFRVLFTSGHIVQIYLDELPQGESLNLGLVRLIVAPKRETVALAKQLASQVGQVDRERMIEFIKTVLLYKFPQMSRDEVEAMFTLSDLKKNKGISGCAPRGQT